MRKIYFQYEDPLDAIWLHAAGQMGMTVIRDANVFASWDGCNTLRIGVPESLDADDSMAQMILHETCHALIEGPGAWDRPDWGLEIDNPAHRVREHAALRLQAALTTPFGLRHFLAATTNFRAYYDSLPNNPLQDDSDPATSLAATALASAQDGRLGTPLQQALERTAAIAGIVGPLCPDSSLWSQTERVRKECRRHDH